MLTESLEIQVPMAAWEVAAARREFGATAAKTYRSPVDYTVWRDNFGATPGSGSLADTAVPEPGTLFLLALAALASSSAGIRHRITPHGRWI